MTYVKFNYIENECLWMNIFIYLHVFTYQLSLQSWPWQVISLHVCKPTLIILLFWLPKHQIVLQTYVYINLSLCFTFSKPVYFEKNTPNVNKADHTVAPTTSCIKARLVRLWCFVLTMLFSKVLLSCRFGPFVWPSLICVHECHRNGVKSSRAEKVFFFQFPRSPLRGNQRDGGQEFMIAKASGAEQTNNCWSSSWKILENV